MLVKLWCETLSPFQLLSSLRPVSLPSACPLLAEDNEISEVAREDLGYHEPGMVLATSIKPGKVENCRWPFTAGEAHMVSKDGKKKYLSLSEAAGDLERLGGVYLNHEIVKRTVS